MSEITKLYENTNIKPICDGLDCFTCTAKCNNGKYPEFTPEKQLFLLRWLIDKTDLYLHRHKTNFIYSIASGNYAVNKYKDFKESIAEFVNKIWQDLTEEERKQIKEILE